MLTSFVELQSNLKHGGPIRDPPQTLRPHITLNGNDIPVFEETKFLGLYWDSKAMLGEPNRQALNILYEISKSVQNYTCNTVRKFFAIGQFAVGQFAVGQFAVRKNVSFGTWKCQRLASQIT